MIKKILLLKTNIFVLGDALVGETPQKYMGLTAFPLEHDTLPYDTEMVVRELDSAFPELASETQDDDVCERRKAAILTWAKERGITVCEREQTITI